MARRWGRSPPPAGSWSTARRAAMTSRWPARAPCRAGFMAARGTIGPDDIRVAPAAGGAGEVTRDGASLGTFAPTGRSVVYGQAGDDDIQVAGSIALSAWLHGDAGDDRLKGGAGHDLLIGGIGDD